MRYFCDSIWPHVRQTTGAELIIAGLGTETFAPGERGCGVRVLGTVNDLVELYEQARVFVVPTRFAAGIPLKLYEAASYGVPAVVSPLVGEQAGWGHNEECLIASDPVEFADCCSRLYQDEELWNQLRNRCLKRVADELSLAKLNEAVERVFKFVGASNF